MDETHPESTAGSSFDTPDYDAKASAEAKGAIFTWLVAGAIYAGVRWHLLWLPALLLFIPGIFVAALLAALFFIPCYRIHAIVARDWRLFRRKRLGLAAAATLLRILGLASPIFGAVLYVMLLRQIIPSASQPRPVMEAPTPVAAAPFVVKCRESIPEFSLGPNSHPIEAEVQQLCACMWQHMNGWEKETSRAIVEGREREVSALNMRAFPARFGQRVRECGGDSL